MELFGELAIPDSILGYIVDMIVQIDQAKDEKTKEKIFAELDNVILTPHIGWKALETRKRMVSIVRDNIEAFRKGEPINVVN